jgi:hypothetical protein
MSRLDSIEAVVTNMRETGNQDALPGLLGVDLPWLFVMARNNPGALAGVAVESQNEEISELRADLAAANIRVGELESQLEGMTVNFNAVQEELSAGFIADEEAKPEESE